MTKRKSRQYRGTRCLNCETALDISEKYCHQCGQLNSTKKLAVKDFFEEFLSNFYAYDSRLRNSIVSIFTKPGILALEYNQGKRHKYANPFRFFLSISIVLFITFSFAEDETNSNENNAKKTEQEKIAEQKNDSIILNALTSESSTKNILKKANKRKIEYSKDSIYTKDFIDKNISSNTDPFTYTITSFRNFHIKYPEKSEEQALKELGYENNFKNSIIFRKSIQFKSNNINDELFDYFYDKLPFLIFLSLPLLTIMFWIIFYSRNINYTEHLVFSYTYFSFMFLCMILFNLVELISTNLSNILAVTSFLIIFPIYFYKSLRNFYKQSRWKTILKFIILNPLFFLFLSFAVLIMMVLGIILF
jgi:hypothetical protein